MMWPRATVDSTAPPEATKPPAKTPSPMINPEPNVPTNKLALERLQRLCDDQGVSQAELARRLGVSRQTVNERLGRGLRLDWLDRVAEVLGARVEVVFLPKRDDDESV